MAAKAWTMDEKRRLRQFAAVAMPTKTISKRLGRTVGAVRVKASEMRVSLKPRDK